MVSRETQQSKPPRRAQRIRAGDLLAQPNRFLFQLLESRIIPGVGEDIRQGIQAIAESASPKMSARAGANFPAGSGRVIVRRIKPSRSRSRY